jgi:hypothetical protein
MRALGYALLAAVVLSLLPACAQASTLSIVGGELRYHAAPGERNAPGLEATATEYRVTGGPGHPHVDPASGCHTVAQHDIRCPRDAITRASFDLGDRDDLLSIMDVPVPVTYAGGSGRDSISYIPRANGVSITVDGQANDGPLGQDDIGTDVEVLGGSGYSDRLTLGASAGHLDGGFGDDQLQGGAGSDTIVAAFVEEPGDDLAGFHTAGFDAIACGGGQDFVLADSTDSVAGDCEAVGRNAGSGYEFTGSGGPDRIAPPDRWGPAVVHGRGGDDLLLAGQFAARKVYGDAGDDRLQHGHDREASQRELLDGGSGNDRIRARDRFAVRDTVVCGKGKDTAYVDRKDTVSGCERVFRAKG